ncbi:hypothetical protein GBAR_LOCUS2124 [Geodia barretti]|uniref:Uncharacterized protein n=1 Tax=Geodia barretti TaxID=519541 RepID=A0AA35VXV5_GEOBA|nr:hypothetical protein GBAR_LOCUS2124 [Geodia barretti]
MGAGSWLYGGQGLSRKEWGYTGCGLAYDLLQGTVRSLMLCHHPPQHVYQLGIPAYCWPMQYLCTIDCIMSL